MITSGGDAASIPATNSLFKETGSLLTRARS